MRLIEPYAGTAAFACYILWLMSGSDPAKRKEPPVSRQGAKTGFVLNEFRAFGLVRQRWDAVLLNDLDPVCHLFHMLYASSELRDLVARRLWAMVPCPECLPLEVNAALDGQLKPTPDYCLQRRNELFPVWTTTEEDGLPLDHKLPCTLCTGTGVMDARQLWEKIRREPVPGDLVEACAAGLYQQSHAFSQAPISINETGWQHFSGYKPEAPIDSGITRPELASRVSSLPSGMASLADLTARALFLQSRSFQLKPVSIAGGAWDEKGYKKEVDDLPRAPTSHAAGDDSPRWTVAERVAALPGRWAESGYNSENPRVNNGITHIPLHRTEIANRVSLLSDPGGCHIGISRMDALEFVRGLVLTPDDVILLDPPYEGTSGYQAQSCRADVLEIARMGDEARALVLLHESVGLAAELGKGWHQRSASPLRGRASTFHAGGVEREWLTFNRPVQWWPSEQYLLF